MDERQVSLCITTYNRPQLTVKSFEQVLNDPRISKIIILDDRSDDDQYEELLNLLPSSFKIEISSQMENVGMSRNKKSAIRLGSAFNDWCILLDSDNVIDSSYLDRLFEIKVWEPKMIYCPSYARPKYDYSTFNNEVFGKYSVKHHLNVPRFKELLNTCNYFVDGKEYLRIWQENVEMKATDTIWFNYLWLRAGNKMCVVPGLEYEHRIHQDSGWRQDREYNKQKFNEVVKLIEQL